MRRLLALLAASSLCAAASAPGPSSWVGLWGVERSFGPLVTGPLVIDGRASPWHATIAGFGPVVERDGAALRFALPSAQGAFRGRLQAGTAGIVGQWLQPPGVVAANAYATPVVLRRTERGVWQGRVVPLADTLSLYLEVKPSSDGGVTGSFRNPDVNFGRGDPYALAREGDRVVLTSLRDATDRIVGRYDRPRDTLELDLTALGARVELTRRSRGAAPGFYPATPAEVSADERPPLRLDDGWETGSLAEVGLDPAPLRALVAEILATQYAGFHTPYVHSLLVARHGRLVLERYFYGFARERVHDMRSASKTFTGMLVGRELERGAPFTLETPVTALFPEVREAARLDARKERITVEDLLTMTSGLACDDNDEGSPGNEDTMQGQSAQPDWYRYTLDLPMLRPPGGGEAVYCSAGINLLGGVLRRATGRPLPELFYRDVAAPLDIGEYHLNLMPGGDAYMGGGVRMRPRDQLKLGQLYLDRGRWRGRRVIGADWVARSLAPHAGFGPGHDYGYAWHLVDVASRGRTYRIDEAGGNGGQLVLILPALDMVVGFTGGNYGDFGTWRRLLTELVPRYLIPAADPPSS